MKTVLFIFINLFFLSALSSQTYLNKKGVEHLWGSIQIEQLTTGDYQEWFEKNQEDFTTVLTTKDGKLLDNVQVKIFLGTWCGDTKYLVPKFLKCWEAMGMDSEELELIGVHNEDELYKQGPNNETKDLNIHRVPTFIFEKDGKEIGRIVERTVFDLDTDIKTIASGGAYEERYQAVSILNKFFLETDQDSLMTNNSVNSAYKLVRREVSTYSELNTYGYVLLTEKKLEQAEFILLLNRHLFPFNPNARDSYGEILLERGKLEEAKTEYLEALRLKSDNSNAIAQLAKINEQMENEKADDIE